MHTRTVSTAALSALVKNMHSREWHKQGVWPGAFLWFHTILEGFSEEWTGRVLDRSLAIQDYACLWRLDGGALDCLIGASCFSDVRLAMQQSYNAQGPEYFQDYANGCEDASNRWVMFAQEMSRVRLDAVETTDGQLADNLESYFSLMRESAAYMDTIIALGDLLGDILGGEIDRFLANAGILDPSGAATFLAAFSPPPIPTNVNLAEARIIKLADDVRASEDLLRLFALESDDTEIALRRLYPYVIEEIEDYLRSFSWLNTYSFLGIPYSITDVIRFVQDRLEDMPSDIVDNSGFCVDRVLAEKVGALKPPMALLSLLKATTRLAYVNAAKDDANQISWHLIQPLVELIASRVGIDCQDLTYLKANEIVMALRKQNLDMAALERRREAWCLVKLGEEILVVEGQANCEKLDTIHRKRDVVLRLLSGRGVFPGIVRGRVRVVLNSRDCAKVEAGDILVSTNTSPDFIPAMRRAAAYVTDTGNLICHAVIAAREFRKPCIISVGDATEVLTDGELVEVNATAGTIQRNIGYDSGERTIHSLA